MKILGMYQGSDLPLFKSFELNLNHVGVSIIRGVNKNVVGMEERNNGSGKSLLLSGISEILISSIPSVERNETIARKALFPNSKSMIMLEIDNKIISKGRFNGNVVSYGLETKNGLEKVKKEVASEYLVENLGYNEDLFYTLVYLDGGKDFPLIVGTPNQRIQFLSNIFADIEMFSQLHGVFSSKLKDYTAKLNRFNTLQEELSELGDVDTKPVSPKSIAKLKTLIEQETSELEKIRTRISNVEMQSTFKKLQSTIAKLCKELKVDSEDAKRLYNKEGQARRDAKEHRRISIQVKDLITQIRELREEENVLSESDLDDSNYEFIGSVDSNLSKYNEWADDIKNGINELHKTLKIPFRISKPTCLSQYEACDALLKTIQFYFNNENLVSKATDSSPTTIASKLKVADTMTAVTSIGNLETKISKLISFGVDLSVVGTALTEEQIAQAKKAHKNVLRLEDVREDLKELTSKYKSLKHTLDSLPNPSLRSDSEYEKLGTLVQHLNTLDSLGFNGTLESKSEDLVSLQEDADKLERSILVNRRELTELKERKRFNDENESVVTSIKESIAKLEKYERLVPLVASIKKAFSNNGIRTQVLNALTQDLASRMNATSYLTFPEPMKFEFSITERTCEITAIRNPGTEHEIRSDVRFLSRGECKSFNLLLMYNLLPMIPSEKRVNIAVMDEMTSNMDSPTKLKIFREFIPALREVVPHIIIADTGNLEIDDAVEYNVVKKGSKSKLVKL